MKRLLQVTILFAVLACFAAGSASALTFQDRTCDNDKPTCPLPAGNAEVPYQFDMYARSGCPPYHYDIDGGTPPPGLTLSTVNDGASGGIGRLKGTPTTPGSYAFWVKLHTPESPTCLGDRADRLFTITIGAAPLGIKTSSLRRGVVGATYTETLTASGGGSQTWSATGLPAGLAVSGSTITGTPTTAGNYPVTVSVNNGTSTKSAQFTLQIIDPLKVTGPASRPAEVGKLFTATFQVSGGLGTYSWAATEVPAGLTFDAATHVLSGTPSAPGPYTVKVTVTDGAAGLTQDLLVKVNVAGACRHHDEEAQGGDRRQEVPAQAEDDGRCQAIQVAQPRQAARGPEARRQDRSDCRDADQGGQADVLDPRHRRSPRLGDADAHDHRPGLVVHEPALGSDLHDRNRAPGSQGF